MPRGAVEFFGRLPAEYTLGQDILPPVVVPTPPSSPMEGEPPPPRLAPHMPTHSLFRRRTRRSQEGEKVITWVYQGPSADEGGEESGEESDEDSDEDSNDENDF